MKELRAVLANRDLGLLIFGRLVSSGGDWLYNIALSIAIYHFSGGSTFLIGVLWIAKLVPNLIAGAPGGVLADRLGYRRAMVIADLGRGVLVAVLALILSGHTWPIIYPFVVAFASLTNLFRPASRGLIPQVVHSQDEFLAANATMWGVNSLAMVVGAALGGVIAGMGLINELLAIEAATFGFSAATLFLIHPKKPEVKEESAEEEPSETTGGLLAGLRLVKERPSLVFAVATMAPTEFADGALVVWFVPYAIVALHLGNAGIGYLYAAQGIGAVLGALAAAALGGNARLDVLLALSVAAGGIGYVALGVVPVAVVALAAGAVLGVAGTVEYSAYETLVQQSVPQGMIGRVTGTIESGFYNLMLVGNIASGLLSAWLGLGNAIILLGAIILATTIVAWWNFQRTTAERPTAESLARIPVFSGLPFEEREWAVRRMARERFPRGTVVIHQGDEGDKFYAISRGKVQVDVRQDGHADTHEMGPGEVFGEIALIENIPRTATITALTPLTAFVLSREDFDELQQRASEFRESLLDVTVSRRARDEALRTTIAQLG